MKLLITGIHGFVGSNLVTALDQDFDIYGLDITAPEKTGILKTFSWEDLEKGVIPNIDAIIHLAGKAHDTKNKSEADIYFKINTGLTRKIFNYFQQSTARKFIFFSSIKAAADSSSGETVTENIIPSPVGPYGESKVQAEKYIMSHIVPIDRFVYILRPCMIHGPGNKGNLNLLCNLVRKGIPWPLGAFENRRTFTSIDNMIFVIKNLLEKDIASGVYHMADDESLSTNQLIEIICSSLGKKARIWHINKNFIFFCASLGTILHLPLNKDRLHKLVENYVVSNSKIKQAIGIDKMPVRADNGLRKTLENLK